MGCCRVVQHHTVRLDRYHWDTRMLLPTYISIIISYYFSRTRTQYESFQLKISHSENFQQSLKILYNKSSRHTCENLRFSWVLASDRLIILHVFFILILDLLVIVVYVVCTISHLIKNDWILMTLKFNPRGLIERRSMLAG